MNFNKTTVTNGVEILVGLTDMHTLTPIKVASPLDGYVVKAGTPLTAAGASTTGANAIGILLYDVDTAMNPNGTIVQSGPIDSTKAQAHSGVTYADALYAACPAIQFRVNIGVNGVTGATGATGETGG